MKVLWLFFLFAQFSFGMDWLFPAKEEPKIHFRDSNALKFMPNNINLLIWKSPLDFSTKVSKEAVRENTERAIKCYFTVNW